MLQIVNIVALVLAVLAVTRSPTKIRTSLYICGTALALGSVGVGLGVALHSAEGAAGLAVLGMQLGMIVASIERIVRSRKNRPTCPVKPA
jgi:hypothetical protein